MTNLLKEKVLSATAAQAVELSLSSSPNARIALGEIDKLHCTATDGKIGELFIKEMTLDGEKIKLDVPEILFPDKEISSQEHFNKILISADKLELNGIVNEENLKEFLMSKADKIDNLELKISPEEVSATGQVKIIGRTADVELAGVIIADEGDLYFRMTRLNVRNAILRHVQLDRFLGDIKIIERDKLPMGLTFHSVELREGEALLSAARAK